MAPFTAKPSLDKLPLAMRKDLRDNYEAKKNEVAKKVSDLLGKPFTVTINPNEIFAYGNDYATSNAGGTLTGYIDGFLSGLQDFVKKYGEDGIQHFNEAVSKSELTLTVNVGGDSAPIIQSEVKDGVYRILFREDSLGYNVSRSGETMVEAIEGVPRSGLSLVVKTSIKEHYDPEIAKLTSAIAEITAIPDVILDANVDENFEKLRGGKDIWSSWQEYFGRAIIEYFNDGLKAQLESQGFKGDDMLQEGLAEVLTTKTFKIRIVDTLEKGSGVNETVVRDGVCYLQTIPSCWNYNSRDMGSGLLDLL